MKVSCSSKFVALWPLVLLLYLPVRRVEYLDCVVGASLVSSLTVGMLSFSFDSIKLLDDDDTILSLLLAVKQVEYLVCVVDVSLVCPISVGVLSFAFDSVNLSDGDDTKLSLLIASGQNDAGI